MSDAATAEIPTQGWVVELEEARHALKRDEEESSFETHLRVAVAYAKLRKWDKSKAACEKALQLLQHSDNNNNKTAVIRQQLLHCLQQANREL